MVVGGERKKEGWKRDRERERERERRERERREREKRGGEVTLSEFQSQPIEKQSMQTITISACNIHMSVQVMTVSPKATK